MPTTEQQVMGSQFVIKILKETHVIIGGYISQGANFGALNKKKL